MFKNKGITILETLIYTAILGLVVFTIFKSLSSTITTHRAIKLSQTLESSAAVSMERILREIRNADSIDMGVSSFNSSPGILKLSGIDENDVDYTITFDLSGGVMRVTKDSGTPAAITSSAITISSLIFRSVSTSNSEAVRVEISFTGSAGGVTRDLDLFGFAVLRGSY